MFAKLRWDMSRGEARALYPQARTTPLIKGRNPFTHAHVVAGGDELVPGIVDGLNANLIFEADRLVRIELWPDSSLDLLVRAQQLVGELGIEAELSEIPQERTWFVNGVAVTLTDSDGFRISMRQKV